MARLARVVVPGVPHHVTQRGNRRQETFFGEADYAAYLSLLSEWCGRCGVAVWAYCLMPNHVHLIVVPKTEEALAQAVGRTHFRYTQYINRFGKRSGHLWQGRFYSCALDTRHFWLAMKYIELNPVRARLCRKPWRYEWSSAAAHVDEQAESEILNLRKWYRRMSAEQWRAKLAEGLTDAEMERLRLRTHTGRPLGSDSFLSKLETALGRRVRPLPGGRPRKE